MRKIIFDLDDTLYVSKELRRSREKAILNLLGGKVEKYLELKKRHTSMESLDILGIGNMEFFELMSGVEINLKKDLKLVDLLKELKNNYELIVLSNSSRFCVKETLIKLGIFDLIDSYYSSEDFGKIKPCRECFFMVKRGDICVGDNFRKDLEVPKQMGAKTIFVGGFHEDADKCVDDVYELGNFLKVSTNSIFSEKLSV